MIKNEKGYTLILVLIIITITMILSLAITGSTLTASKQFNKTDNRNMSTDLAEMGITYFLQVNNSVLQEAKLNNPTNFCSTFTNILKDSNNTRGYYTSKTVDGNNKYQITLDTNNTTQCTYNPDQITVVFYSKGITAANEQATLKGTFTLNRNQNREGEIAPQNKDFISGTMYGSYPSNSKVFMSGTTSLNGGNNAVINYTVWFNQLVLSGNATLLGNYDAIFNDSSQNGNTNITVNGDAIFFDTPSKFVGNASICVKGNVYYVDQTVNPNVLRKFTNFDSTYRNYCSSTNSKWFLDSNNGIQVDYNQ